MRLWLRGCGCGCGCGIGNVWLWLRGCGCVVVVVDVDVGLGMCVFVPGTHLALIQAVDEGLELVCMQPGGILREGREGEGGEEEENME